jgi:hypothetical protein
MIILGINLLIKKRKKILTQSKMQDQMVHWRAKQMEVNFLHAKYASEQA